MLLLLATYGLRACEVAALTLDDMDWRNERLKIRDRKAGNTTTYPLSVVVGAAVIDYLKNGRPATTCREVFMRSAAPLAPIGHAAVVCRAAYFIRKAGIRYRAPVPTFCGTARTATAECSLFTEAHRRLRWPPQCLLDPDLREDRHRATA